MAIFVVSECISITKRFLKEIVHKSNPVNSFTESVATEAILFFPLPNLGKS